MFSTIYTAICTSCRRKHAERLTALGKVQIRIFFVQNLGIITATKIPNYL